jgi:sugar phosphate isomerase/epimerase
MSAGPHLSGGDPSSVSGLPALGVFAKVFERATLVESFAAARAAGFSSVHLDLAMVGGETLPSAYPLEVVSRVRGALADAGLAASSIEGTYNMAHRNPEVRDEGRRRLALLIEHARNLGTDIVTLCSGSRADGMWKPHADNASREAWADMRASVAAAAALAEAHGVVVCIECENNNVVSDARRGRRLLDELASPAVRIAIDAANLVPPGRIDVQAALLEEAFELLGDDIVIAHAKDVDAGGRFVAAGAGEIDYRLYLDLLERARFTGVLELHGLRESDVPASLRFLRTVRSVSDHRLPSGDEL